MHFSNPEKFASPARTSPQPDLAPRLPSAAPMAAPPPATDRTSASATTAAAAASPGDTPPKTRHTLPASANSPTQRRKSQPHTPADAAAIQPSAEISPCPPAAPHHPAKPRPEAPAPAATSPPATTPPSAPAASPPDQSFPTAPPAERSKPGHAPPAPQSRLADGSGQWKN
jgi:hypothetical protein